MKYIIQQIDNRIGEYKTHPKFQIKLIKIRAKVLHKTKLTKADILLLNNYGFYVE